MAASRRAWRSTIPLSQRNIFPILFLRKLHHGSCNHPWEFPRPSGKKINVSFCRRERKRRNDESAKLIHPEKGAGFRYLPYYARLGIKYQCDSKRINKISSKNVAFNRIVKFYRKKVITNKISLKPKFSNSCKRYQFTSDILAYTTDSGWLEKELFYS